MSQVGDLAMKALRGAEAASHEDEEGDGSWLLGLLKVKELEPSCLCCILIGTRTVLSVLHPDNMLISFISIRHFSCILRVCLRCIRSIAYKWNWS
jgi:hypothetical protein